MSHVTYPEMQGSWALESFELEKDSRRTPWGSHVHGLLIYTPGGHVSVSINKTLENDSSQTEAENTLDSLLFYSGTYVIEGEIIRHQVTNASDPARIGKEMIRFAKLNGDRLILTTPEESFGRAIIVWKRINT